MQVESAGGRVSRSGDWAGRDKNGERKGEGGVGIANTDECQGCTEVPGTSKLLLLVHPGLCNYSQTPAQYGEKG